MTREELSKKVKEYMKYLIEAEYEHEPDNILEVNSEIHKMIEHEEKYRWHDLRKNPEDFPEEDMVIEVVFKDRFHNYLKYFVNDKRHYGYLYSDKGQMSLLGNIIAWRKADLFKED